MTQPEPRSPPSHAGSGASDASHASHATHATHATHTSDASAGRLRVAIAGGGIGGLCLAQGLHRHGLDVTVLERDVSPRARGQGYRLHLDANGMGALRRCLPRERFDLVDGTTYRPAVADPRITVLTKGLRQIRAVPLPTPPSGSGRGGAVDRATLRRILLGGLDGRVRFGAGIVGFTDCRDGPAGGVAIECADGSSPTADVLVLADGAGSRLRARRLPDAVVNDTGGRCVFGRTPLTPETEPLLPDATRHGFTAVVGFPRPRGMGLGVMRLPGPLPDAGPGPGPGAGAALEPFPDYVMWAFSAPVREFRRPDDELSGLSGQALTDAVLHLVRRWHPDLRALVAACERDATAVVPIRVAAPVRAWPPSTVTLIGDAVHAMTPSGGQGANTALRDAGLLCQQLVAADRGERPLLAAIGDYESEMRGYGFAAAADSRRALPRWLSGR